MVCNVVMVTDYARKLLLYVEKRLSISLMPFLRKHTDNCWAGSGATFEPNALLLGEHTHTMNFLLYPFISKGLRLVIYQCLQTQETYAKTYWGETVSVQL